MHDLESLTRELLDRIDACQAVPALEAVRVEARSRRLPAAGGTRGCRPQSSAAAHGAGPHPPRSRTSGALVVRLRWPVREQDNAAGTGRQSRGSTAGGHASALIGPLRAELTALDRRVLSAPVSLAESLARPFIISWQTRRSYQRLIHATRQELARRARDSAAVDQHAMRLEQTIGRYLSEHLAQVRQVARFNSFERLFSLWHVVHVPFFLMMIFSAQFHVFAVHLF